VPRERSFLGWRWHLSLPLRHLVQFAFIAPSQSYAMRLDFFPNSRQGVIYRKLPQRIGNEWATSRRGMSQSINERLMHRSKRQLCRLSDLN
jgi:hypothetical protein